MTPFHPFLEMCAFLLRARRAPKPDSAGTRILVIRRSRLGDMLCTVPLLHALRRHFPQAHIAVACDAPGAPAARACKAVDDVIVLSPGWNPRFAPLGHAARLQGYDRVIAAKAGFDRRLAVLTRLTNAPVRIGFESPSGRASAYYTDPVPPPEGPRVEHQIDAQLRLLRPLGIDPAPFASSLALDLPPSAREFAADILARMPCLAQRRYMLINISSTRPLKFSDEDLLALMELILKTTGLTIGIVAAPADQPRARELAAHLGSDRLMALATPGPIELAALLEAAVVLLTPEGGAAHLAAAVGVPALVLWSEGPFEKWHSRATNHRFVRAESQENKIPLERVWRELQPCVA